MSRSSTSGSASLAVPLTAEQFRQMYPDEEYRRGWARSSPLAWLFQYQPTILLPGKGYIPFEPWPFQIEFLLCKDRFRAINKPRQCGISTLVAAEVAWEVTHIPGAQIIVLSKDLEAALNFAGYVYNILNSAAQNDPDFPKFGKQNQREITFPDLGSRLRVLASGKEAGRSFSATHWVFDEMAFAENADSIFQAAAPSLAQTNGRITVVSTPKGRANLYAQIFDRPEDFGFTLFNYKWWDVPTYNPHYDRMMAARTAGDKKLENSLIEKAKLGPWYKGMRGKYTDLTWANEFEGSFDASDTTVFSYRQLEKTFWKPDWLTEGDEGDSAIICRQYWTAPAERNHVYVTGVDLGRKRDPTVIITYDTSVDPALLVEFKYIEAGAADFPMIEREIRQTIEKFNDAECQIDATGSGDAMSQVLEDVAQAFIFTKFAKENIIRTMQLAMDNQAIKCPKIQPLFSEHQKYIWHDKDIRQDCVMANALAVALFYDPDTAGTVVGVSGASLMETAQ